MRQDGTQLGVSAANARMSGWVNTIALRVALPILTIAGLIGLWWLATIIFDWPAYLVPTPGDVWNELVDERDLLADNFVTTLYESLLGFALAIGIAVPAAVAIAYSRTLELTVYPALVALNAIPKIAIAPLLVIWMGFGAGPKIVMVILICFFPIVISTATGLKSTPAEIAELSRSSPPRRCRISHGSGSRGRFRTSSWDSRSRSRSQSSEPSSASSSGRQKGSGTSSSRLARTPTRHSPLPPSSCCH